MSTENIERNAQFPASGPDIEKYVRYRFLKLGEEGFMIYDTELKGGWIKSQTTIDLESWR